MSLTSEQARMLRKIDVAFMSLRGISFTAHAVNYILDFLLFTMSDSELEAWKSSMLKRLEK